MSNTKRIIDSVDIALGDEYLSADKPSELGSPLAPSAIEDCFDSMGLGEFDRLVESVMRDYNPYVAQMDIHMTVDLHKSLPLTRRQASDTRFWAWLGVVYQPDFVAWRWKAVGTPSIRSRDRFYGNRVRQTYARLWWAAELTREGDDYSLTETLINLPGFQDVYEAIFGRAFGNYLPAMKLFIELVGQRKEKFIRQFAKELGYAFTTVVLETMDEEQIRIVMTELSEKLESRTV